MAINPSPMEQQQMQQQMPNFVYEKGITVVSPMWGDKSKTDRMVYSVLHQFISPKNPFKIHLVLVDDYLEKRGENGESYYADYENLATDNVRITIIKNPEHKYQGESREIGFNAGDYNFFLLVDCDDMLAPNACDRFLGIIAQASYKCDENPDPKPIACIYGLLYSFDTNGYDHNIPGNSIWVQSRCYNREFIHKHGIHFPTGTNSRQGEDYPFIRKLDYAINHDQTYVTLQVPYDQNKDCQATAFWFPNDESLSRQDPHYGQHLSGWTMASSNSILDFFEKYNKEHGFEDQEDEYMKHEYLNMTVYSFYNLLDFIREVAATDYDPKEEDWYALRDNVKKLRQRLLDKYYSEIVYSDIEDMLYQVKHFSDCRFVECWFGTFFDYMKEEHPLLRMDYEAMRDYCRTLEFDGANHEIHSPQVKAWENRHKDYIERMKAEQAKAEAAAKEAEKEKVKATLEANTAEIEKTDSEAEKLEAVVETADGTVVETTATSEEVKSEE